MKDISKLMESVVELLEEPAYADIPRDLVEAILTAEAAYGADRGRARDDVQGLIARHCAGTGES